MALSKKWSLRGAAILCVAAGSLAFASNASACGYTPVAQPAALEFGGANGLLHRASENNPGSPAIVGLWSFTMTAGGQQIDFGYQQWHSDGTELMNSGGRAPATENYCMGVYKQTGPSTYHLHHIALSYDTSGTLNARVVITEDVTVDHSRNSYSGTFTLDFDDPNSGAVEQHLSGDVTGTRVEP